MAPPAPRRFFFTYSLAGRSRSTAPSRSTRSTGRCELGGLLRQHPLRRSTETGLLAALAPRFGGSVSGADRSAEMARANQLDHPLARARTERAGRAMAPPAPRRFFFAYSLAGWRCDRAHQVDRPLSSYGVGFDNTRFAAALRLGC